MPVQQPACRFKYATTLQEVKNLAELADRHLVDERYSVCKLIELLERFAAAVAAAMLIDGGAHSMKGRAHAARHVSLDATAVAAELVDHDLRYQEFETLLLEELTTSGNQWLTVDFFREVEPDASIGEHAEHPVRILRPPGAHRRSGPSGGHCRTICRELLRTAEISSAGQNLWTVPLLWSATCLYEMRPTGRLTRLVCH